MESGYALAVKAIIDDLVPAAKAAGTRPGRRPRQVNVLAGAHLTPGDLEHLKELIELFDLRPVVIPDVSDSLDGHLTEQDFSPLTVGGALASDLVTLGDSVRTLVVGASLDAAADLLAERTGVPDTRLPHLMGLDAVDSLVTELARISARASAGEDRAPAGAAPGRHVGRPLHAGHVPFRAGRRCRSA